MLRFPPSAHNVLVRITVSMFVEGGTRRVRVLADDPKTEVRTQGIGTFAVPGRRARFVRRAGVGAATNHAQTGAVAKDGIDLGGGVDAVVPIPAPFGGVAVHVVQAPVVVLLFAGMMEASAAVRGGPAHVFDIARAGPGRVAARAAGVLPLRLERQPIAAGFALAQTPAEFHRLV